MQLIIETPDEKVLQAIVEFIRPFKVTYQQVKDENTVSVAERKRRLAILKKFKGGLKDKSNGYQPSKHEWYEQ